MRTDKNLTKSREKLIGIATVLKERLHFSNLFREFDLVVNMTNKLEIKWQTFTQFQPLKNLQRQQILNILKQLPFLIYIKKNSDREQCIKIQYQNANRIILVSGIYKDVIEQMLKEFNLIIKKNNEYLNLLNKVNSNLHNKVVNSKIIANNGFWISIQTQQQETANILKRFLRNKKVMIDSSQEIVRFKIERRKVRIILLREDFYTLMVDAMMQTKHQIFLKQFQVTSFAYENIKIPSSTSINIHMINTTYNYRTMILNTNQINTKIEYKEQLFSDGFSQSNSLNSDILDSNKIKDIIQTSEQGIQAENTGQFIEFNKQMSNHSSISKQSIDSPQNAKIEGNLSKNDSKDQQSHDHFINSKITIGIQPFTIQLDGKFIKMEQIQPKGQVTRDHFRQKNNENIINQDEKTDDPFININKFSLDKQIAPSTGIQTREKLYTTIPFAAMRKLFKQFNRIKSNSMLIELPDWMKRQSQQQRNRHLYFRSLCQPKIIHNRLDFQ